MCDLKVVESFWCALLSMFALPVVRDAKFTLLFSHGNAEADLLP